ncbi:MAG: TIM barrel protein [Planctomycetota bacterium]|nr:TIM barrel protein [Planctomycetota bacterium]MDA1180285.1 TIM barrel protein [Planctomycetota bacterium]
MFRNLNNQCLRVSGRQSELIELALTYRFKGLDIDVAQFHKHAIARGFDHAYRFLQSAEMRVGSFALPVRWETNEFYQDDLKALPGIAETAQKIGAPVCVAHVLKTGAGKPYHENFEFQRSRLSEIADQLAPHGIQLGISFTYASHNADPSLINSVDALTTLVKTIVAKNVGVVVDLFEWHFGGGKASHLTDLGAERVALVRVNDAGTDATTSNASAEKHRKLGMSTGVIDATQWADALRQIGYDGPLTPFPHPAQLRGMTRDRIVKAASESLDKMLRESLVVEPIETVPANGHLDDDIDEDAIAAFGTEVVE